LAGLPKAGDRLGYLYRSIRNHLLNQIARKDIQGRYIASITAFAERQEGVNDHRVREEIN